MFTVTFAQQIMLDIPTWYAEVKTITYDHDNCFLNTETGGIITVKKELVLSIYEAKKIK